MNESIDRVHGYMGTLMTEVARARRLLVHPLPVTERSHLLVNVADAVHDLEEALIDLMAKIKEELHK